MSSLMNYYDGLTQAEKDAFYQIAQETAYFSQAGGDPEQLRVCVQLLAPLFEAFEAMELYRVYKLTRRVASLMNLSAWQANPRR